MELNLFDLPQELIPKTLQEISDACGQEAAMTLFNNYAGSHVRIPINPTPGHRLCELLGMTAFKNLSQTFSDEILQIPRCTAALRYVRNQQILRERGRGMTQGAIARRYGMTEREINKICNSVKVDMNFFAKIYNSADTHQNPEAI